MTPAQPPIDALSLSAPHSLSFPYRRTMGTVIGAFLGGLVNRRILAARTPSGGVVVPPTECDPLTGADIEGLVEVGTAGVLEVVAAIGEERWGLVRLDGATTTMLHRVEVGDGAAEAGVRVRARWRAERFGHIDDIACFETTTDGSDGTYPREVDLMAFEPIVQAEMPIDLVYTYSAGQAVSRFMSAIAEGRILGQRCPVCQKVYVPPTGSCAVHGVATTEDVELTGEGAVMSFTIVNVPFHGQKLEIPYVLSWIILDGADIPFPHLVSEVSVDEVHIGMRVHPRWVPDDERRPDFASIRWFRPVEGGAA